MHNAASASPATRSVSILTPLRPHFIQLTPPAWSFCMDPPMVRSGLLPLQSRRPNPCAGSWSKGRNGRYAYYHCRRRCRAVNVSKAVLEGAFVDELALLQPTPGYMRLVKDRILCVWQQRCAEAGERTAQQERRVKAIRQKLDRLDEAFLYSESIDLATYSRQRDKL